MGEVPNAYECDYCRKTMTPIETKSARWHQKFCSCCGMCLYDVFIGQTPINTGTY
jgi:hypothetical protein